MANQPIRIDRCPKCAATLIQRTLEQNDKFHAVVQDIADQKDWPAGSGRKHDVRIWKQLISAAYERAKGRHSEMYPSIDGHGVDVVYWQSSRRSKEDMADLITFAECWAVDNGVRLKEESYG